LVSNNSSLGLEHFRVKIPHHFESLKTLIIENFEEGLALFSLNSKQSSYLQKNNPEFTLEWTNETFDVQLSCKDKNVADRLNTRLFTDYAVDQEKSPQVKSWSLLEFILDSFQQNRKKKKNGVMFRLAQVGNDTNQSRASDYCQQDQNYISFNDLRAKQEILLLKIVQQSIEKNIYFIIYICDISDVHSIGLSKIQKSFQTTFTNALSHERLTPLNSILNMSELIF